MLKQGKKQRSQKTNRTPEFQVQNNDNDDRSNKLTSNMKFHEADVCKKPKYKMPSGGQGNKTPLAKESDIKINFGKGDGDAKNVKPKNKGKKY